MKKILIFIVISVFFTGIILSMASEKKISPEKKGPEIKIFDDPDDADMGDTDGKGVFFDKFNGKKLDKEKWTTRRHNNPVRHCPNCTHRPTNDQSNRRTMHASAQRVVSSEKNEKSRRLLRNLTMGVQYVKWGYLESNKSRMLKPRGGRG